MPTRRIIRAAPVFRFQTGSIKSARLLTQTRIIRGFDSKLVRLKAGASRTARTSLPCFDSKLVRLKDCSINSCFFGSIRFDSKLVRLKDTYFGQGNGGQSGFDSKLVRLKVVSLYLLLYNFYVSIPNWFD